MAWHGSVQDAVGPLTDRHHVRDSPRLRAWEGFRDGGGRVWFADAKSAPYAGTALVCTNSEV